MLNLKYNTFSFQIKIRLSLRILNQIFLILRKTFQLKLIILLNKFYHILALKMKYKNI